MRFHVDFDLGDDIRFWIVPDNPQADARAYLFIDHVFRGLFVSNEDRPVIRDWGWHSTGLVGFKFDETNVPGVSAANFVEVYDVDTLVLVYRRTPLVEHSDGKLFRYATGLAPDPTIDQAVFESFRLSYTHVENVPEETLSYMFDYHYSSSVYLSGRLRAKEVRRFLEKNKAQSTVLIEDPYRLLARQILWLRTAGAVADDEARRWRVAKFAEPIALARELALGDSKALRRQLARLDDDTFNFLSNPITRQFGSDSDDAAVAQEHYVLALDEISRVSVIGHTAHFDAYVPSLSAAIGRDIGMVDPAPEVPGEGELALVLRQIPAVQELIGFDLMLADAVEATIAEQWANG